MAKTATLLAKMPVEDLTSADFTATYMVLPAVWENTAVQQIALKRKKRTNRFIMPPDRTYITIISQIIHRIQVFWKYLPASA
jgi:hypothetical protein